MLNIVHTILHTENVTLMHTTAKVSNFLMPSTWDVFLLDNFDITCFKCLFQFCICLVDFHKRLACLLHMVASWLIFLYVCILSLGRSPEWTILVCGVTSLSVCMLITYMWHLHLFFLRNCQVWNHHSALSWMSFIIKTSHSSCMIFKNLLGYDLDKIHPFKLYILMHLDKCIHMHSAWFLIWRDGWPEFNLKLVTY